jgi:hypothetical protein
LCGIGGHGPYGNEGREGNKEKGNKEKGFASHLRSMKDSL